MSSGNLRQGARFGKWTLLEKLGQGGNGAVWLAVSETEQRAAIKFLTSNFLQSSRDPDEQELRQRRTQRFQDEIDFLWSHKGDDGILPIVDSHSPNNPTQENRPWFATEVGEPVTVWIDRQAERLSSAVSVVCSVARTLSKLHGQMKFHRDIKPDNILMLNGQPTLGDFGLVDFPGKPEITDRMEILGPRFYIAPEMLIDAEDVDGGPADVYSLAKTLWVLGTGYSYPIPGEQRITEPALTLSEYVDHPRSKTLDVLMYTATRHSPTARISMSNLHAELDAWSSPDALPENTEKRVARLAPNLRAIELRRSDSRSRFTVEKDAARRLVDISSEYLQPQLRVLEQLAVTDFEGHPLSPSLCVHDHSPPFWDSWPSIPTLDDKFPYIGSALLLQQFCGLSGRSLCYCGGSRTALTDSGTVRVTIAHAYGSINSDSKEHENSPWIREFSADVGLPTTEAKLRDLLLEFVDSLPSAVEGVLQMFDRLCETKPP
jgi:serine/threonine protein kinase